MNYIIICEEIMKKSKINFTLITSIIVGFFSIMLKDKNVMNDASIIYKIIWFIL